MSKINTKDPHWNELYNYVKSEIMGYDETKKLPKHMILRLIGMTEGKFMANNNIKAEAKYSFKEILITFKIHKQLLINSSKHIKEEQKRFNYIMAIVENKINDVCQRLRDKEKAEEKMQKVNIDSDSKGAEYKKRTKHKDKLEDLW